MGRFLLACCAVLLVAGCSSSSRPTVGPIGPARTYSLSGFRPLRVARPGPARVAFTIRQPSGAALTDYRRGAGPHTGVHLIVVRDDLGVIIHRHPPIAADGRISETIDFPSPGPYRVLVDAYPGAKGAPRNFQLHTSVRVGGAYRPQPLPPFAARQRVGGYTITLKAPKRIAADPGGDADREGDRPERQAGRLPPLVRRARARDLLPAGLARLLPHARLRAVDARLHEHLRRREGRRPPGRAGKAERRACCCPSPGPGGLFLQFRDRGRIVTAPFTLRVR